MNMRAAVFCAGVLGALLVEVVDLPFAAAHVGNALPVITLANQRLAALPGSPSATVAGATTVADARIIVESLFDLPEIERTLTASGASLPLHFRDSVCDAYAQFARTGSSRTIQAAHEQHLANGDRQVEITFLDTRTRRTSCVTYQARWRDARWTVIDMLVDGVSLVRAYLLEMRRRVH